MWVLAFVLLRQYNGTSFNMFAVLDPTCRHCFSPGVVPSEQDKLLDGVQTH